ncbi:MAG: histidinol dehydrogenase, partial [Pseudomonadota bacterium]|nr:histidinol dehydrogenase [Pseudomonadota bacterium]
LAAAALCEVDRVFTVGGAQAIAALAFGTDSIPAVDKIVGPGNRYVATAKRLVFGTVGIDMVAGPSEIVVVADGTADPKRVALDLFAQAEHDEAARAIAVSWEEQFLQRLESEIERLLPQMGRRAMIEAALNASGALVLTADAQQAADVVNQLAPEHLQLSVGDAATLLQDIRHAGAIFIGHHSAEVFGDYCAGPNHVLPTGRTARFSSPLGVYDFQKRSSLIHSTAQGARELAAIADVLATSEGLDAHARSARARLDG